MRAVRLHHYGQETYEVEDVPPLPLLPGDVRIDVHASSVNPIDWKIALGTQRAFVRHKLPWIIGMDVSGVVSEVGSAATGFSVGDEVYAVIDFRRPGCYAEQVVLDAKIVSPKPKTMSHEEAASIPLAGLTAWQCLVTSGVIAPGHRVLIQAGAGGVGTIAIQIAKAKGAEVWTTCSARNADLVRSLGADHVIDYNAEAFDEVAKDMDIVLDALGGEARSRAMKTLVRGGRLVSIVSDAVIMAQKYGPYLGMLGVVFRMAGFLIGGRLKGLQTKVVVMRPNGSELSEMAALIDAGKIRPLIDKVYPLEAVGDAFAHGRTHRTRGKVVIKVR